MKKRKRTDMVVHSNDLIEAFYDSDLTATEHKIIRYASSLLKENPDTFPVVHFTVSEFLEAGGMTGRNYHNTIKNIGDELSKKRITLQKDNKYGWVPWLSSMYYEEGSVRITFNHALEDLLLGLDTRFTKYNYKFIGSMQSSYSIRIYEILKQYAPIKTRRVMLNDLKKMLGVEDKYKSYGNFKQRVLNQAKKEMDEKGVLTFEFDELKEGRKVVGIIFYIELREKELKPEDMLDSSDLEDFLNHTKELLARYQIEIKENTIRNWEGKYSLLLIEEALEETKNKKINFPDAFYNKVLENKKDSYLKKIDSIKADKENTKLEILMFINENKTSEVIPDWFLKNKFEKHFKGTFTKDEIENMWDTNKSYIIRSCQLNA